MEGYLPAPNHFMMLKCEKRLKLHALLHSVMTDANNNFIFQKQQHQKLEILTINKSNMLMNACNHYVSIKIITLKKSFSQPEERNGKRCQLFGLPLVTLGSRPRSSLQFWEANTRWQQSMGRRRFITDPHPIPRTEFNKDIHNPLGSNKNVSLLPMFTG